MLGYLIFFVMWAGVPVFELLIFDLWQGGFANSGVTAFENFLPMLRSFSLTSGDTLVFNLCWWLLYEEFAIIEPVVG